jgi:hypothetical protein
MNKRLIAVLPLLCVLALAMGGSGAAPTVAAPTTPTLTAPATPASIEATPDEWGACRWYCGSKSYPTASQCAANCSFQCEDIC